MLFVQVALFTAVAAALEPAAIEARDETACITALSSASSALMSFPTTDVEIMALIVPTGTNSCEIPLVTGSDAKPFSEWASKVSSYQDEHKKEINAVETACSGMIDDALKSVGLSMDLSSLQTSCDKLTWSNVTGSASATATGTSESGAARQAAAGVFAVAIAGIVAAMV